LGEAAWFSNGELDSYCSAVTPKERMTMATLEKSVYRERLKTELREFAILAT
jgi:hypothetical protein